MNVLNIIPISLAIIWLLLFGKLFCGKICPGGLLQDLLFKIPSPRKIKIFKADKYLRLIKYVVLSFQVVMPFLSLFVLSNTTQQSVYSRSPIIMIIIGIVFICITVLLQRPFCKYLCTVGAISSLANKISFYKYRIKDATCSHCGLCSKVCKMNIDPSKKQNTLECIRCGKCKRVCPKNAIVTGFIQN
jgi:polyferredoxin